MYKCIDLRAHYPFTSLDTFSRPSSLLLHPDERDGLKDVSTIADFWKATDKYVELRDIAEKRYKPSFTQGLNIKSRTLGVVPLNRKPMRRRDKDIAAALLARDAVPVGPLPISFG
uniref:DUF1330 domain-containing protein n=1 Tax=Ascaris lumbricoides TaxID=6252 RepID=A0A0M3IIJ5_ASCLU